MMLCLFYERAAFVIRESDVFVGLGWRAKTSLIGTRNPTKSNFGRKQWLTDIAVPVSVTPNFPQAGYCLQVFDNLSRE
jgi:hypothetical protein